MDFEVISNIMSVLSAIAVPIIVLIIGNNFSKKMALEKGLRDERVPLYKDLLEPLIILYAPNQAFEKDKKYKGMSNVDIAMQQIQTKDYNQKMFEMSLIAPDSVIRSFNNFYQYLYTNKGKSDTQIIMNLWGMILLEIRKSMGNSNTELHQLEMLEWKISDIKNFKVNGEYKKI